MLARMMARTRFIDRPYPPHIPNGSGLWNDFKNSFIDSLSRYGKLKGNNRYRLYYMRGYVDCLQYSPKIKVLLDHLKDQCCCATDSSITCAHCEAIAKFNVI